MIPVTTRLLPPLVANWQYSTCWIVWYARMTVYSQEEVKKMSTGEADPPHGLLLYCHMTLLNVNMLHKQVYKHPINTDDYLAKVTYWYCVSIEIRTQ